MNLRQRIDRLEDVKRPGDDGCAVCRGQWCGVVFDDEHPDTWHPGADPLVVPFPPSCQACGRAMGKVYAAPVREIWQHS